MDTTLPLPKKQNAFASWLVLRVAAIGLGVMSLWAIWFLSLTLGADHARFVAVLSQPLHAIAMAVFVILAALHAALGAAEIIEDYIHTPLFKHLSLMAVRLGMAGLTLVCLMAIGVMVFRLN